MLVAVVAVDKEVAVQRQVAARKFAVEPAVGVALKGFAAHTPVLAARIADAVRTVVAVDQMRAVRRRHLFAASAVHRIDFRSYWSDCSKQRARYLSS